MTKKTALDTDNKINLEDRARARRAWLQGGPGNNDPKELGYPGEIKYPRMEVPVGGDSRQWEQQWFEGAAEQTKQKMGPSGVELELKKKLQRAKLIARFVRQANRNDSYWEFGAKDLKTGKKVLLFKASVDEIFGEEGKVSDDYWKYVSSPDYSKQVMENIRSHGVDQVAYALRGIGITREGTVAMIRKQALDKANEVVLLGRRVARSIKIASGQIRTALEQDYRDLQATLDDLKLVEKSVSKPALTKASDENKFVLYKLADDSVIDANRILGDVYKNVVAAERGAKVVKAGDVVLVAEPETADEAAPVAPDAAAPAPAGGGVETPTGAKDRSAPMPGGGMGYEEGGQLYPNAEPVGQFPLNDLQPASHGDLPFRQWEQLELKNLAEGPDGHYRDYDKAESASENLEKTHAPVPSGDINSHQEAAGGGISSVSESSDPSPGLNTDLADGRWGFEGKHTDFATLPFGGLNAAPAADAGGEVEEAPAEDEAPADDEAPAEEEESTEEAGDEEVEEESSDDSDEEDEGEEEEEYMKIDAADRSVRAKNRSKIYQTALEMGDDQQKIAEYYSKLNMPGENYWGQYGASAYSGTGSRADGYNAAQGGAQAAAPAAPAPEATEDADLKASFEAKKLEAAQKEAVTKQRLAYDLAIDLQKKGYIDTSKESLHKKAQELASLDEKSFQIFRGMCGDMKTRTAQREVEAEDKSKRIASVAGKQRPVIKTASPDESNLATQVDQLSKLPWS